MGSVPDGAPQRCVPLIKKAAQLVARKLILPWHLQELKAAGFRSIQEGKYDKALGAPFEQQAWLWIVKAVEDCGTRLRSSALAGELPEPSNEQIREALEAFSTQEWRDLISQFGRQDVDVLRGYLDANKEPLGKWLGQSKFYAILGKEIERGLLLTFKGFVQHGCKRTTITDALWAPHWRNLARQRNVEGRPRPSVKRSMAETGSLYNIAESLGTTPYKVKEILRRVEQTPFEEFDGAYDEYLLWATDPKAYKRHLHLRETAPHPPRRDPDPYFLTHD